ncbi:hypothetical protein I317_03411 [Kwoniella heveanensis CBS 569]|nr:hypothetical protein I317_03411 [Kwoniella heveanensis CBS 569]
MAVTANSLPQPVIFAHAETLHAIPLPPLASFLVSLHKAEHLIKLNDILDRYRTPKSYHRIDVRLVESSELPPGTPESFTSRDRRGSREPVFLEEGTDIQAYLASRAGPGEAQDTVDEPVEDEREQDNGLSGANEAVKVDAEVIEDAIDCRQVSDPAEAITPANGPVQAATSLPEPDTEEIHDSITFTRPTSPYLSRRDPNPNPEPTHPLTTLQPETERAPSPPVPTHPLPPIGPTRRVRELRLDLRTLDAAALFALESWRREVMGLEKMEMQFPDSIWYKDSTPTPPPSSPPPKVTTLTVNGKKRGRPKKERSIGAEAEAGFGSEPIIMVDDETREEVFGSLAKAEAGADADGNIPPVQTVMMEEQTKGYESLVSELQRNVSDTQAQEDSARQSEAQERSAPQVESTKPITAEVINDSPQQSSSSHENSGDPEIAIPLDATATTTNAEAGPSTMTPQCTKSLAPPPPPSPERSPSPDIFLHDAFDEKEDDDPDFVPPRAATARRRGGRPGRSRKSLVPPPSAQEVETNESMTIELDRRSGSVIPGDEEKGTPSGGRRVAFDLTPTDIVGLGTEQFVQGQTRLVTFAEAVAGPSRNRRSRSRTGDDAIDTANAEAGPSIVGLSTVHDDVQQSQSSPVDPALRRNAVAPQLRGNDAASPSVSLSSTPLPNGIYLPSILKNTKYQSPSMDSAAVLDRNANPRSNVPSPRTPTKKPRGSKRKSKMVVEIPSASKRIRMQAAEEDGEDEEQEEWGFLKAFG